MSKRRLQLLVLQRNRMLKYLRREQREAYTSVITGLAIRPNKNFDPTIKPRRTTWVAKRGTSRRSSKLKSRPYGELTRPTAARRERSLRLGCDAHQPALASRLQVRRRTRKDAHGFESTPSGRGGCSGHATPRRAPSSVPQPPPPLPPHRRSSRLMRRESGRRP